MTWGIFIFAAAFGSIPFGRVLYTIFGELPERGKNLPALVLWQRGYPRLAAATGVIEALKIWFIYHITLTLAYTPEVAAQAVGLGLLAHMFSPWFKFAMNFAVAPFMGVLLTSGTLALGLGLALWWQVWRKTGKLAWAAIVTLGCIPLLSYAMGYDNLTLYTLPAVIAGLVWQARFIRI